MPKKSTLIKKDSQWLHKQLKLNELQRRVAALVREGYTPGQAAAILTEEICKQYEVPPKVVVAAFILFWGMPATD